MLPKSGFNISDFGPCQKLPPVGRLGIVISSWSNVNKTFHDEHAFSAPNLETVKTVSAI